MRTQNVSFVMFLLGLKEVGVQDWKKVGVRDWVTTRKRLGSGIGSLLEKSWGQGLGHTVGQENSNSRPPPRIWVFGGKNLVLPKKLEKVWGQGLGHCWKKLGSRIGPRSGPRKLKFVGSAANLRFRKKKQSGNESGTGKRLGSRIGSRSGPRKLKFTASALDWDWVWSWKKVGLKTTKNPLRNQLKAN